MGRPPYPPRASVGDEELEFVWNWLDHYFVHGCEAQLDNVVGYLEEFRAEWHSEAAA